MTGSGRETTRQTLSAAAASGPGTCVVLARSTCYLSPAVGPNDLRTPMPKLRTDRETRCVIDYLLLARELF